MGNQDSMKITRHIPALVAVGVIGLIAFGLHWEDAPASPEKLQTFITQSKCHDSAVGYDMFVKNGQAFITNGDLWAIAKDCEVQEERQKDAQITAGQYRVSRSNAYTTP